MTNVLHGGRHFYGFDIGVLVLDNSNPRPLGDIGNAQTWDFPILYEVVESASAQHVVEEGAAGLLPAFIEGARKLERLGVKAILTSCGFLAVFQRELAAAVGVPVATSSLLQLPLALQAVSPERKICVLTINGEKLTREYFESVGVREEDMDRITVVGLEHSEMLYSALILRSGVLDVDVARADMVAAARGAVDADDSIGAFVMECTNMPPYTEAVRAATGLPVWDVVTLGNTLYRAVSG
ncbi:aspartate/glutamate racemase family protein [Leucobacter sp. wl10]|uniref:aspartate/glutamate racemase family protein n=1 Tax=Leucobacter sp. wl10 TaxID=2304677 RepID=UPI000E5B4C00|nr:aspartate/glutamate racemase family protein [Leucobacter sp. wl10]RGE19179.1 aspartate/glutamate racemase family protein [Leucobacter sp. wl10]